MGGSVYWVRAVSRRSRAFFWMGVGRALMVEGEARRGGDFNGVFGERGEVGDQGLEAAKPRPKANPHAGAHRPLHPNILGVPPALPGRQ